MDGEEEAQQSRELAGETANTEAEQYHGVKKKFSLRNSHTYGWMAGKNYKEKLFE
jgi:hypothetical protein